MNPPTAFTSDPVLQRRLLRRGLPLLLLLGLAAWAWQDNHHERTAARAEALDRHASERALALQGRLDAVVHTGRFAAARLRLGSVRQPDYCTGFLADLLASQTALTGAAVHDGRGHAVCHAGHVLTAADAAPPPGAWRLRAQPDGSLRLDHRHAPSLGGDDVRLALRLDETTLVNGLPPGTALTWTAFAPSPIPSPAPSPAPAPAPAPVAQQMRELRVDGEVVGRLVVSTAPSAETAVPSWPSFAAVTLAGGLFTAMLLLWAHRTRQRADSQRPMHIARQPEEAGQPGLRISDGDLAAAARVVADEQRQSKRLNEQLRHAKDRLDEVQRAASMGSWRHDLAVEQTEWSDQAHEIFGVPRGETLSLERLSALVHPEDRLMVEEHRRALVAGHAEMDVVHRIERAGGEERVVHARGAVATRDAHGRPAVLAGTVQDVTAAWEAAGLRDALTQALALSTDPVLMTREHAGIWLWAWSNRAWDSLCEQLQIDGREADFQLFNETTGLLRAHVAKVREARAQRKVMRLDLELHTVHGARCFDVELIPQVGAPGRAGHGLLLLRDRSAERQAVQALSAANARLERVVGERTAALARSEQQYRVLADLSPQILWQADRDCNVTYFNRAWHELVGPRASGWLGRGWLDALHPDDVPAAVAALTDGARKAQPWQARRRVKSLAGTYRSLLGAAAPTLSADGAVEGWVGVEADITELEYHASRLQQLNGELETFSYTVSHDLRAPVHVIKGFVEALLAGQVGQIDAQARGYLERVLRSARRMEELISDLLALARLSRDALQRSRFDPGELARGLVDGVRERYPGRGIEFEWQGERLVIEADERLFKVLLENLLDNAAKFTAGRPVCRITFTCQREHDMLVLSLADNGVGFPAEFAHRLFRPYQRLHAQADFPGHGIGLATVARIVQLHGGSISAHNAREGGAVFSIRLPVPAQITESSGTPAAAGGHASLTETR